MGPVNRNVRKVSSEERIEGPSKPGMDRFTAFEAGGLWGRAPARVRHS